MVVSASTSGASYPSAIAVVGVNHRTASVEAREILARLGSNQSGFLRELKSRFNISEGALISTCNRFEIVVVGDGHEARIAGYLSETLCKAGVSAVAVEGCIYRLRDRDAVRHLFKVAASLDSLALGEAQILGQVKDAYRVAVKEELVGRYLHALFQYAFRFAKRIRGATAIGRGEVSISYVAVKLAQQIFGDLAQRRVLLIGSGEMAELTALHMKTHGCRSITIANRTLEKAVDLAARIGGAAAALSEIDSLIDDVDMIICSIRADVTVIEPAQLRRRKSASPLFLIDLGVPRNLSPALADIDGAYLYGIDDLGRIVDENRSVREEAAKDAEVVLEYGIHQFERWLDKLATQPRVLELRAIVHDSCREELSRALRRLQSDEDFEDVVAHVGYAVSQRVSHELVRIVRALAPEAREEDLLALILETDQSAKK